MMVTYTAVERLRLSILPFFVMFAMIGLDWLLRREKHRFIAIPLLIPLVFLFSRDTDLMRDNSRNWDNFVRQGKLQAESYRLRDDSNFPAAREALARSIASAPWMATPGVRPAGLPVPADGMANAALRAFRAERGDDPTARFDRAILMIEAGDLDGAERSLLRLAREGHAFNRVINRPARPAYHLGRIAALRGRRADAVKRFSEALTQAPGDLAILAQLSALTGDPRHAAALSRYFGELNALAFLADAHLENGQPVQAAVLARQLVASLPEYWKGQILLAAALSDAGRDAEAASAYLGAMRKRSDPVIWPEKIVPAFRRLAERKPADDTTWFRYATALRQSGSYPEALEVLRRSMARSDNEVLRREFASLKETMRLAGLE